MAVNQFLEKIILWTYEKCLLLLFNTHTVLWRRKLRHLCANIMVISHIVKLRLVDATGRPPRGLLQDAVRCYRSGWRKGWPLNVHLHVPNKTLNLLTHHPCSSFRLSSASQLSLSSCPCLVYLQRALCACYPWCIVLILSSGAADCFLGIFKDTHLGVLSLAVNWRVLKVTQ